MKRCIVGLAVVVVLVAVGQAEGAPVTLNGITFSELTGAFTIDSGSGSGSSADPFVLNETVTDLDVTMTISGLPGFGNPVGTGHVAGFALIKRVTNNTGETWDFYDHELQEILGTPSAEGDGLSFAQGSGSPPRPWTCDLLPIVDEVTDVRDFINFSGGTVAQGQVAAFYYAITDNSPVDSFYLRQRPNYQPLGGIPEPSTLIIWSLLGGLAVTVGWWRKRKAA